MHLRQGSTAKVLRAEGHRWEGTLLTSSPCSHSKPAGSAAHGSALSSITAKRNNIWARHSLVEPPPPKRLKQDCARLRNTKREERSHSFYSEPRIRPFPLSREFSAFSLSAYPGSFGWMSRVKNFGQTLELLKASVLVRTSMTRRRRDADIYDTSGVQETHLEELWWLLRCRNMYRHSSISAGLFQDNQAFSTLYWNFPVAQSPHLVPVCQRSALSGQLGTSELICDDQLCAKRTAPFSHRISTVGKGLTFV